MECTIAVAASDAWWWCKREPDTIGEISRFGAPGAAPADWRDGDTWLAGRTWLLAEPQPHLRRLVDLDASAWEPFVIDEGGLQLSATYGHGRWQHLHVAAGRTDDLPDRRPRGQYVVWRRDGGVERIATEDFVIGDNRNVLEPGDLWARSSCRSAPCASEQRSAACPSRSLADRLRS